MEHEENESRSFVYLRLAVGALLICAGVLTNKLACGGKNLPPVLFAASWLMLGYEVLAKAARGIAHGRLFDENTLMTAATVGAFAIGEWTEAAAVMLFFNVGESLEDAAYERTHRSVAALSALRPERTSVFRGGEFVECSPEDVRVGDTILVKPGERIPLDGVITDGETFVDTRTMTGESVPRSAGVGEWVMSGCVNLTSPITVRIEKEFCESSAARLVSLVEEAESVKARGESLMTRFARVYTPIVVGLAAAVAVIPSLITGEWMIWLRRGLVTLVASCPCALVVGVPLTYFCGIGRAARDGILIKGSAYLEMLADIRTVAFDKTGTLTRGVFEVTKVFPVGVSGETLLADAAAAETYSSHPIADALMRAHGGKIDRSVISDYAEIAGRGVRASVGGRQVLAGNADFMRENGIEPKRVDGGGTVVHVAAGGVYEGCIMISDEMNPSAREVVKKLKKRGLRVVMLTGDRRESAEKTAAELGLTEYSAELLPDEKFASLERISDGGRVVFVGDGINDAPSLARADIGIAMGGVGSDAAVEAADAVLMTDDLCALTDAISVSEKVHRTVRGNVVFALAVKAVLITAGWLGFVPMWAAVFGDVGVLLIVVLSSLRVWHK